MVRLIILILGCAAWPVDAAAQIAKGDDDLLRNPNLSQSFTVLDQLLLTLARKASVTAKDLRPEKSDFRPSRGGFVYSSVSYDRPLARTGVAFQVTVTGIDDPWRD